jgi:hypothetical protein
LWSGSLGDQPYRLEERDQQRPSNNEHANCGSEEPC